MTEPRISCILPALGDFEGCIRAIKCFQAQTYPNRELVIVDGGVGGLASYVTGLGESRIILVSSQRTSANVCYGLGVSQSTGSLIAAWPEYGYSDPLRLTFQYEIMEAEKKKANIISSISLAVLGRRRFGSSRQGLWWSTLLAPPAIFLSIPQTDLLEDAQDGMPVGIELSVFTAPDHFVALLPETNDAFIARRFDGAFENLPLADVVRMVERLKFTDDAHSRWSAYDALFHAQQMWPLDEAQAEKHFASFMKMSVSTEWCAYDALNNLAFLRHKLKKTPEFLESVTTLLLMDPSRAEAYNLLGIHYHQKGQPLKAIPFFTAATQATRPHLPYAIHQPYYSWLPYDYLSDCYRQTGNITKAIETNLMGQRSPDQKERLKQRLAELVKAL